MVIRRWIASGKARRLASADSMVTSVLGDPGRLISLSKSAYQETWPDNLVVFNANVCLGDRKVWYGDVDLTRGGEGELRALAEASRQTVYLLYEWDGRFEQEQSPAIESAVFSVVPSGHYRFDVQKVERRADGLLYTRPYERAPFTREARAGG